MLEVQKFLQQQCTALGSLEALQALKEATGVKANIWEDKLVVLNYCQIESKKTCAITQECRSLVLEMGTWAVVSRSFNRFYNYGESPCPEIDITQMVAYEKVDGSLIGLFNYQGEWLYRTRSVIMPVNQINAWEVTWKDHIEEALGENYKTRLSYGFEHLTFILELTSRENRVVTKYASQTPQMTLLAMRDNEFGHYVAKVGLLDYILTGIPEWRAPRMYMFGSVSACLEGAKELRDLQEGYVLYNRQGEPVCKMKNPAYVAAHHLRGEGLNPKRIKDLIIMGETDEYLAIFPEDKAVFMPYHNAYLVLHENLTIETNACRDTSLTQKEFALRIKDVPYKGLLFSIRKGMTATEAWDNCTTNNKYQMIDAMMEETA